MNELTLLREAGPAAPDLTTDVRGVARAALMAEIDGTRGRRRVRLPSRKVRWRVGIGLVAVAASWAAAVVIAAPDPVGSPATRVTLVDFDMPTFPLSLDHEPPGLRPAFDGDGDGASIASYHSEDHREGFALYVSEDEPEDPGQVVGGGYRRGDTHDVEVGGKEATVVHGSENWCWGPDGSQTCAPRGFTELVWERGDDQWVRIEGHGSYDDTAAVIAVAESLVDRPQRATLTAEVAPAGWSVQFFKMGRVLTLVNDAYEQQTLSVHVPLPEEVIPADRVRESIMGPIGPQLDVTVHGRPAQLVLVDTGYLGQEGWYLQAQFADGTTFVVQAPEAFTQEQVLELAESVTYNP